MLNLCVIFTGGTIGSRISEKTIFSDHSAPFLLLSMFEEKYPDRVHFTVEQPYTLLSENLTPKYWKILGQSVESALAKGCYDAIIITHGSDTLQYSAAVMGFAFCNTKVPLFLVASNYVLQDERANGFDHFCAAVFATESGMPAGIYVPYRNSDGVIYLHEGVKTLQHLSYSDDLYSTKGLYCGIISQNGLIRERSLGNKYARKQSLPVPKEDAKKVFRIFSYPGMTYEMPDWSRYGAVLIDTYHSGTLCAAATDFSPFLEEARRRDIPVFVAGAGNEVEYDSVKEWKEMGLHVLPVASPLAMYIKAWMLLTKGIYAEELVRQMYVSMAGEF